MRCAVIFGLTLPSQTTSFFSHHQFFIFFPRGLLLSHLIHLLLRTVWWEISRKVSRNTSVHFFTQTQKTQWRFTHSDHCYMCLLLLIHVSIINWKQLSVLFTFFFGFACHALTVCVRGQCCSHHKKGVVDKLWIPHWLIVTFQVDVVNLSIYTSSSYLHYPLKLLFAKSSTHQSLMLLGTAKKTSKQNK